VEELGCEEVQPRHEGGIALRAGLSISGVRFLPQSAGDYKSVETVIYLEGAVLHLEGEEFWFRWSFRQATRLSKTFAGTHSSGWVQLRVVQRNSIAVFVCLGSGHVSSGVLRDTCDVAFHRVVLEFCLD
jgi:hypothetical protein